MAIPMGPQSNGAMNRVGASSPIESLRPTMVPGGTPGAGTEAAEGFKRALEQIAGQMPTATSKAVGVTPEKMGGELKLKFSSHAIERMRSRGISFAPDMMQNIENAVGKAAAKGSKDTLVLAGDSALIISVKNSTVVTVMDKAAMKDNVFTNIDSTVVV